MPDGRTQTKTVWSICTCKQCGQCQWVTPDYLSECRAQQALLDACIIVPSRSQVCSVGSLAHTESLQAHWPIGPYQELMLRCTRYSKKSNKAQGLGRFVLQSLSHFISPPMAMLGKVVQLTALYHTQLNLIERYPEVPHQSQTLLFLYPSSTSAVSIVCWELLGACLLAISNIPWMAAASGAIDGVRRISPSPLLTCALCNLPRELMQFSKNESARSVTAVISIIAGRWMGARGWFHLTPTPGLPPLQQLDFKRS